MTGNRIRFDPEPITAAIPPSTRGYIETAPEPGRHAQVRVWLHGDGSRAAPRSLVLTHADVRRLCAFLYRLVQSREAQGGTR